MKLNDCSKCGAQPKLRNTKDRSGEEYRCGGCGKNGGRKNTASGAALSWNACNRQTKAATKPFIAIIGDEFRMSAKGDRYNGKVFALTKLFRNHGQANNLYELEGYGSVSEPDLIKHFIRMIPKEVVPAPQGYGSW